MKITSGVIAYVALLALIATGCGVDKDVHDRVLAKNKRLERDMKSLKQQSAEQLQKIASLESDLKSIRNNFESKLADKKAELAKRLAELAIAKQAVEELNRIKKELADAEALRTKLREQFQAMISAGQLQLVNVNGRLVIKMASKILFKSGRANTTSKGAQTLKQIATILAKIDRHFQVAGHTDDVPMKSRKYQDNWALSGHRATVVVRLLEKNGVPGNRLSAAGFSQFQPVASNRTKDGKQLNRRIEITLLPSIPSQTRD
ncbi:MAG: flagellar motor protein MotB [bacterium]